MTQTFILQNQLKLFYGKSKEWVDGYDANALFKTPYKDEAINQMVEISSKDYTQRVKVLTCSLDDKGLPVIDGELMPAPLPKAPKQLKPGEDLFAADTTTETEDAASSDDNSGKLDVGAEAGEEPVAPKNDSATQDEPA